MRLKRGWYQGTRPLPAVRESEKDDATNASTAVQTEQLRQVHLRSIRNFLFHQSGTIRYHDLDLGVKGLWMNEDMQIKKLCRAKVRSPKFLTSPPPLFLI